MTKRHARLSPSAAKRWMICPGSVALIEGLNVKDSPSRYAAEGTVAHEVGELCLRHGCEPSHYLGKVMEADGFRFTVNQDMVDAIDVYINYVDNLIPEAEIQADIQVKMEVEVRCSLKELGIPGLDGGTTDTLLICDHHQFIENIDYKHGKGVSVEVYNNPQTRCYSLGVLLRLGIKPGDDWTVVNTIVQPRAHHFNGPIRQETVSSDEIWRWAKEELIPAAKATLEDNPPIVPSDDGCRFCAAAKVCPKLYERSQEVAMLDFSEEVEWGNTKMPEVNTLTAKQKAFIMEHAAMLRAFIVAVEKGIKEEVDAGSKEYEDKFKLVHKTTHRKFKEDLVDDITSPIYEHLKPHEVFVEKPKAISDIEKLLIDKIGKEDAKEIMDEITFKPEGGTVIANISDRRKAVEPSIISDFTGSI